MQLLLHQIKLLQDSYRGCEQWQYAVVVRQITLLDRHLFSLVNLLFVIIVLLASMLHFYFVFVLLEDRVKYFLEQSCEEINDNFERPFRFFDEVFASSHRFSEGGRYEKAFSHFGYPQDHLSISIMYFFRSHLVLK